MALLLIIVPFSAKADDEEPVVFYESEVEDEYILDDSYVDDYDDEDYEDYYYDDADSYYMEADDTLDLDSTTTGECGEKKVFTASNIIFLAAGMITGVLLTIVAVACTRNKCTCGCNCECNKEEKKEKKTTKKNDK